LFYHGHIGASTDVGMKRVIFSDGSSVKVSILYENSTLVEIAKHNISIIFAA